jgi:hypothetical protein
MKRKIESAREGSFEKDFSYAFTNVGGDANNSTL